MKEEKHDLLIIGGGPAGLAAAIEAAKSGLDVLVVEKKPRIDYPIHCGEGIGGYLLGLLPWRIPRYVFLQVTRGIRFLYNMRQIAKDGTFWKGATIDRSALARWMYSQAITAGAEIRLGTEAVEFERAETANLLVTLLAANLVAVRESEKMLDWPEDRMWKEGTRLTRRVSARIRELVLYSGLLLVLRWRKWRVDTFILPAR